MHAKTIPGCLVAAALTACSGGGPAGSTRGACGSALAIQSTLLGGL